MKAENKTMNISILPKNAQKQLFDFYDFLLWKYKPVQIKNKERQKCSLHEKNTKLPKEFYRPIVVDKYLKVTREEIYEKE